MIITLTNKETNEMKILSYEIKKIKKPVKPVGGGLSELFGDN